MGVLIAPAIAAVACAKWIFPDSLAQFFYPVVIVACSALVLGWGVFGVAGIASLAVLIVARRQGAGWLDAEQVTLPIMLNLLTAAAAWLGARQMRLALTWMQSSYTQANDLLEQLRDERQHLALTVKMLEDAHYRITKLNYSLIEARSAAEQARRLKAEFAANISHELRTPLNMIIVVRHSSLVEHHLWKLPLELSNESSQTAALKGCRRFCCRLTARAR